MATTHILLVEDDANIREIAELALSMDPDMVVHSCTSGFDAMKQLWAGTVAIDLILLDMTLHDSTGLEVIRELRATPALRDLPVIFFTASAHDRDVAAYRDAGAIGVISKPFDPTTLAAQIKRMLAEASA